MENPQVSIIIPTYNRPHLLPRAIDSALGQTVEDLEVVVVDDGSEPPVKLVDHPRLRLIRLPHNQGTAVARNRGAEAAQGRWIAYLDDDDQLLANMVEISLTALAETQLPPPVAVLSGLEVVTPEGKVLETRIPPTLARGSHFFLEALEVGKSFLSKQTLFVERQLLLQLGGYDETFQSRVHTEMFLRLNPVCSILGLPQVTYRLTAHSGPRVSRDPNLRQVSFHRLIEKHQSIFQSHPEAFAQFIFQHAKTSYGLGQRKAALLNLIRAVQVYPPYVAGALFYDFKEFILRVWKHNERRQFSQ